MNQVRSIALSGQELTYQKLQPSLENLAQKPVTKRRNSYPCSRDEDPEHELLWSYHLAVLFEGVPSVTKTDKVTSLKANTKDSGVLQKLTECSKSNLVCKYWYQCQVGSVLW